MIVEDCMNVYGRGWVLVVSGDELVHSEIHCGEKIVCGETVFTIKGVERTKYDDDWWSKHIGLVLSPNDIVPDCFEIGDEIEILQK